jgi:hypothetical protein
MGHKKKVLKYKKIKENIVVILVVICLCALVVIPLRVFTIWAEAVEKPPPNIEKIMGPAFNFPMIKSSITFRFDKPKPKKGIDIWKAIFGGPLTLEHGALRPNTRALVAHSSVPVRLKISYRNTLSPLSGLWRGESAFVQVNGALEGKFQGEPGNKNKKWGWTGHLKSKTQTVTPYFYVSVPFNEANTDLEISDRIISLNAVLRVTFPGHQGMNWTNYTHDKKGNLECLVLSPGETQTYKKIHKRYLTGLALKTLPLHGAILLLIIGLFVFVVRHTPDDLFEE